MKEKIFYVVNLDKKRISVLSLFLVGLISSFFFLGVSVGKGNRIAGNLQASDKNIADKEVASPSENSLSEKKEDPKQEEVALSNISPHANNTEEEKKPEAEVIDLEKPGENVGRQENLYQNKPTPNLNKKTPKNGISSPTKSQGAYSVQLVAFNRKSDADLYLRKLSKDNARLSQKPFIVPRGKLFLVRIGKSNDKDELKKLLSKIKVDENIRKQAIIVKNS